MILDHDPTHGRHLVFRGPSICLHAHDRGGFGWTSRHRHRLHLVDGFGALVSEIVCGRGHGVALDDRLYHLFLL